MILTGFAPPPKGSDPKTGYTSSEPLQALGPVGPGANTRKRVISRSASYEPRQSRLKCDRRYQHDIPGNGKLRCHGYPRWYNYRARVSGPKCQPEPNAANFWRTFLHRVERGSSTCTYNRHLYRCVRTSHKDPTTRLAHAFTSGLYRHDAWRELTCT